MKKGPQIKSVYSKAKEEQERQLTDADVFTPLPQKRCAFERCGKFFVPIIKSSKFCSEECFYKHSKIEMMKPITEVAQ